MTTELINKCLNCNTDSKEFAVADGYEDFTKQFDEVMYECPTCGEIYEGSDLAEEQQ